MLQRASCIVETVAPCLVHSSLGDIEQALLIQGQVHQLLTGRSRVLDWHAHLGHHCLHNVLVVQGCKLIRRDLYGTTSLLRFLE